MSRRNNPADTSLADRRRMIDEQIRRRKIRDPAIIDAMMSIPRERFVPESRRSLAYADRAVPIGHGQTISQPFIVAFMTAQLELTSESTVLEIGTGCGYQTAILSRLCKHVFSIERIEAMNSLARKNLADLGVHNATLSIGDGTLGLPAHAPFDRIIVTAGAPRVPKALVDQLADNGLLLAPVGNASEQTIMRVVRQGHRTVNTPLLSCRFVKLIGQDGWAVSG